MSIVENPHPTRRYVNLLFVTMKKRSLTEITLRASTPLPVLAEPVQTPIPTFEHVRNRLKVMSKIDHLKPLTKPTAATIQIPHIKETSPGTLECHDYVAHVLFEDTPPDPFRSDQA